MNDQTKLVFALEHVAHIHDLIKDNEWEEYLKGNLVTIEYELERQLSNPSTKKQLKQTTTNTQSQMVKE